MQWVDSTQRKRWIFTPETLELKRKEAFAKACAKSPPHLSSLLLTMDEELVMQKVFITRLPKLQRELKKSTRVLAVTVAYWKRFFLTHAIVAFSPMLVMCACFIMACKVEEERVSPNEVVKLASLPDVTLKALVEIEFDILDALNFDLEIHSPHQCVDGFCVDMQTKFQRKFSALRAYATAILNYAILSDAVLLYEPAQLGLAAVFLASKHPKVNEHDWVKAYIDQNLALVEGWNPELLTKIPDEMSPYFEAATPVKREVMRPLWSKMQQYLKAVAPKKDRVKARVAPVRAPPRSSGGGGGASSGSGGAGGVSAGAGAAVGKTAGAGGGSNVPVSAAPQ